MSESLNWTPEAVKNIRNVMGEDTNLLFAKLALRKDSDSKCQVGIAYTSKVGGRYEAKLIAYLSRDNSVGMEPTAEEIMKAFSDSPCGIAVLLPEKATIAHGEIMLEEMVLGSWENGARVFLNDVVDAWLPGYESVTHTFGCVDRCSYTVTAVFPTNTQLKESVLGELRQMASITDTDFKTVEARVACLLKVNGAAAVSVDFGHQLKKSAKVANEVRQYAMDKFK